jgi:AhpC/TSA family
MTARMVISRRHGIAVGTVVVALSVSAGHAIATAGDLFRGTISPKLTPLGATMAVICNPSSAPADLAVPKGARVSAGLIAAPIHQESPWRIPFLLIEPRGGGRPFVFVDVDLNSAFTSGERFSFSHTWRRSIRGKLRIAVRAAPPFERYPIELALPDKSLGPEVSRERDRVCLLQSPRSFATAKVRVDGDDLFFRYYVATDTQSIDPTAYQEVDYGRLDKDLLSPHRGGAPGQPVVFRIGKRYLSTAEVDVWRRTVVVRSREASDYRRMELRSGLVVPDFVFDDIDGRRRRLSEFRGRYVLINFWYTGCGGPCTRQFPYLKEAEVRFAARGLTILGLSESGSPSEIRSLAKPSGTTWIEATSESAYPLVKQWFQIFSLPTQLLLDPSGQLIVVGSPSNRDVPLVGAQLSKTLDRVLPLTPPAAR